MDNVRGLARRYTRESLQKYLLNRSERMSSGCLEFRGAGPRHGYQHGPGRAWAHIAAYAAFVGPIDPALVIDHICENPPCIEPAHLRPLQRRGSATVAGPPAGRLTSLFCPPRTVKTIKHHSWHYDVSRL